MKEEGRSEVGEEEVEREGESWSKDLDEKRQDWETGNWR